MDVTTTQLLGLSMLPATIGLLLRWLSDAAQQAALVEGDRKTNSTSRDGQGQGLRRRHVPCACSLPCYR